MLLRWTRITCDARTRRFSGREPRRMGTKTKRDSVATTIREFGEADAAAAAEILNLAVIPVKRRKGEGGALLKAAVEALRARKVSRVFLEVRESNEAGIAFYEKQGFSKTGRRAGY